MQVRENGSVLVYEKGTLICSAKIGSIGIAKSHKCSAGGELIKFNDEGSLELVCNWNKSRFTLKN